MCSANRGYPAGRADRIVGGSMRTLEIEHVTTYRYAKPVGIGDHRLMFRPRDSHDQRLLDTRLAITPEPASIRWLHDVFGNSVAIAHFEAEARELRFESGIRIELYPRPTLEFPIEDYARLHPFAYSTDEMPDLARLIERHREDPDHAVDAWAREFLSKRGTTETEALLKGMNAAIRADFRYAARDEMGVQTPAETLEKRSGSCRDFALLVMEAARSLGFAARFVSGYLHDGGASAVGGGATHAWLEVYLPGAGWVELDPTNDAVGNRDLVRVAVARDPKQAVPLAGTWNGAAEDYLGMSVDVAVRAVPPSPPSAQQD